jgi:hypothetical protein
VVREHADTLRALRVARADTSGGQMYGYRLNCGWVTDLIGAADIVAEAGDERLQRRVAYRLRAGAASRVSVRVPSHRLPIEGLPLKPCRRCSWQPRLRKLLQRCRRRKKRRCCLRLLLPEQTPPWTMLPPPLPASTVPPAPQRSRRRRTSSVRAQRR